MKKYTVIDVRQPEEYNFAHVEGSINLPLGELLENTAQLNKIPKDKPAIVYCQTGNRSNIATKILKEHGFKEVTNGINKEYTEKKLGK